MSESIVSLAAAVGGSAMLLIAAVAAKAPPEDLSILRVAAERLAPPERDAPSAWAERYVRLKGDQSPWPGPFSADVKPFQRDAMDVREREPEKLGIIHVKCAQVGLTLIELAGTARDMCADPGPTLIVCVDQEKAKEYCFDRFTPMLKASGKLARITEEAGDDKKVIGYGVHFPGGKVTFAWATSETRLVGTPYRRVKLDDAQLCLETYATTMGGDLWTSCETRTETYRGVREISANGHPRGEDDGLWILYITLSDRRVWTIDCPHAGCGAAVPLRWRLVRYGKTGEDGKFVTAESMGDDGRPDPALACLVCPHCSRAISETQRARAVWPAKLGGSGRYESELDDAEAKRRAYIGLHTTRLADPVVTVVELARKVHSCGDDRKKLLDVMNKTIGEPLSEHGSVVFDDRHFDGLMVTDALGAEIGGVKVVPEDVQFVTVGVDVQKGPTGESGPPGLYIVASAWGKSGTAFICDARTLVGWEAFNSEYLPRFWVKRAGANGGALDIPVSFVGIDVAYLTGSTLAECRTTIYTRCPGINHGSRIQLVGLRYQSRVVGPDRPWAEAPMDKRIWRERPELGAVDYLYLHRHSWVDRTIRRFAEKRVRMLCAEPPEWREHMNANYLAPVKKQHEWEPQRMEWEKVGKRRDDYARAFDYAEAVASVRGGLEQIGSMGQEGFEIQTFGWGAG